MSPDDLILAKLAALDAKSDAHRAESARRGEEQRADMRRLETNLEVVRKDVERLNSRMTDAESDIRTLRDADAGVTRMVSDHDLEHEAAIGGAIAHAATLGTALNDLRGDVDGFKSDVGERLSDQDRKLDAILSGVRSFATHPILRRALIVAAVVGALLGGCIAGYSAAHGEHAAKQLLP